MSEPISELRSVTCHMGSHSVTCHPTEVNASRLNPSQIGRYSIYLPRRDGRLSWPRRLVTSRDGLPAHRQSPIAHRSINRARRTVTSLIGSDALPLHHAYHPSWVKAVRGPVFRQTDTENFRQNFDIQVNFSDRKKYACSKIQFGLPWIFPECGF